MLRSHRTWHRLIWLTLAPMLAVGLIAALRLRTSLLQIHGSPAPTVLASDQSDP